MDKRIEFLDREGLAAQVIYPSVGLFLQTPPRHGVNGNVGLRSEC